MDFLSLGCLDQATVDEVVDSGDVSGPVGGQERDQRGDLFRGGEATGGEPADAGDDRLAGGLRVDAGRLGHRLGHAVLAQPEVGGDRARRDGVDADAVRAELLGEGLGQVDQGRLGGAVVDGGAVGLEKRIDGGDVDDRPAALGDHLGQGGPAGPQGDEEVQLHRPGEVVVAGAEEAPGAHADGADVVDEHVEPAVFPGGVPDQPGGAVGGGQVDGYRAD